MRDFSRPDALPVALSGGTEGVITLTGYFKIVIVQAATLK